MIRFTPEAIADSKRLRQFLEQNNPTAAQQAAEHIRSAIARLNDFPLLGKPTESEYIRQLIVKHGAGGYIVRYEALSVSGDILVTRIWHGREARD